MTEFDSLFYDARRLAGFLRKENPEEADRVVAHLGTIERSFRDLEEIFKSNAFFWVTEKNLVFPRTGDDVPDMGDEEFPFRYPATCPHCQVRWRFSGQATESFSVRLNMCTVPETVVTCPDCRKKSVICPKGKTTSKDVKGATGATLGVSFSREGSVLRKVVDRKE